MTATWPVTLTIGLDLGDRNTPVRSRRAAQGLSLHVARLAGSPQQVIIAEAVLKELEMAGAGMREHNVSARERGRAGPQQKELFAPPPDPIVEELHALDIDGLSPRDALALLAKWKERAGG